LVAPSEKSTFYLKNEQGGLVRVNHKKEWIRDGGPNGINKIGMLPGLEELATIKE